MIQTSFEPSQATPGEYSRDAAVLANQRTLVALCPFAPLSLEVGLLRHAGLAGEMSNNATSNVFTTTREAAIELEGLEKNGETESSSARLCAKKFKFALGKRPVQSEFLWMPVLLHGPPFGGFDPSTKSKLAAERVHDQTATAKLAEKEQSGRPWFCPLCRNFDLRYLRACLASRTTMARKCARRFTAAAVFSKWPQLALRAEEIVIGGR
jgi:hypothetical protein